MNFWNSLTGGKASTDKALKAKKAVAKGTFTQRKKKVRNTVHFRRPKTLSLPRAPKYPRKSAPSRPRFDFLYSIFHCCHWITQTHCSGRQAHITSHYKCKLPCVLCVFLDESLGNQRFETHLFAQQPFKLLSILCLEITDMPNYYCTYFLLLQTWPVQDCQIPTYHWVCYEENRGQ